jgi:hypothetical protein
LLRSYWLLAFSFDFRDNQEHGIQNTAKIANGCSEIKFFTTKNEKDFTRCTMYFNMLKKQGALFYFTTLIFNQEPKTQFVIHPHFLLRFSNALLFNCFAAIGFWPLAVGFGLRDNQKSETR